MHHVRGAELTSRAPQVAIDVRTAAEHVIMTVASSCRPAAGQLRLLQPLVDLETIQAGKMIAVGLQIICLQGPPCSKYMSDGSQQGCKPLPGSAAQRHKMAEAPDPYKAGARHCRSSSCEC